MNDAVYLDGIPQNLEAASADALEWLLLLQRKWKSIEGSSEWKAECEERLLDAIVILRHQLGSVEMKFLYTS